MDYSGPAPATYIFQRETQVFQPALIEEIKVAVGTTGVYQRGRCVHDKPQKLSAVPQGSFGPLSVLDISSGSIPFEDVSQLVPQRYPAAKEPAIIAVSCT